MADDGFIWLDPSFEFDRFWGSGAMDGANGSLWPVSNSQPFPHIGVTNAAAAPERSCSRHWMDIGMSKMKRMQMTAMTAKTGQAGSPARYYLAVAAIALGLMALPQSGHAQGIVRGAQQGAYDGNRVAGPIGGLVGGAVGAGVGGAMGAVDGVLGIPYGRHYQCRGYYGRSGRFHCYR